MAIVHDALVSAGGAERVVATLAEQWPGVPIYTSVYLPDATFDVFKRADVRTTFLQGHVRSRDGLIERLFPLMVPAFRRLDLRGYDLVLSSAAYAAKVIRVPRSTCHACYCYAPLRLAWRPGDYLVNQPLGLRTLAIRALAPALRRWDYRVAQRVDYYATTCRNVARRIEESYHRQAEVINAPIDVERFAPDVAGDYYLVVSRLTRYKRVDLAIEGVRLAGRRLVVVGEGPLRSELEAGARGADVRFVGSVDDRELLGWYAKCRALIFPQEEDYGLTPLEAQASGRPVVAFAAGGALETVIGGETGVFFATQEATAVADAIRVCEATPFDPAAIRRHAARFGVDAFTTRMTGFLEASLADFRRTDGGKRRQLQPRHP